MSSNHEKEVQEYLETIEKVTKEKKIDLSTDEDLSIGIMNLISIEEHLFFTAEKTKKDIYYDLLQEVRSMRTKLLRRIIKDYEGEVWCISKHLLASSMRMYEVGTKLLGSDKKDEAKALFENAYDLYSLFWGLNLGIITDSDTKQLTKSINKDIKLESAKTNEEYIKKMKNIEKEKITTNSKKNENTPLSEDLKPKSEDVEEEHRSIFKKLGSVVKKAIDCCKE